MRLDARLVVVHGARVVAERLARRAREPIPALAEVVRPADPGDRAQAGFSGGGARRHEASSETPTAPTGRVQASASRAAETATS